MVRGRSDVFEDESVSVSVSREGMNRIYVKEGKVKIMYWELGRDSSLKHAGT